jgi:hypothetical protein
MVELEQVDIIAEVSQLATYSACPRQGHLAAVIHLFAYLKKEKRDKLVFNPTPTNHGPTLHVDWADFYKPKKEVFPHNMPEPRGNAVQMTCCGQRPCGRCGKQEV